MLVRIRIRTPKGQANGVSQKIRPFIIGRANATTKVSPDDDCIIWEIDASPRDLKGIYRNVAAYAAIVRHVFSSRLIKKFALPALSYKDQITLKEMLNEQTKVEVIKEAEPWENQ